MSISTAQKHNTARNTKLCKLACAKWIYLIFHSPHTPSEYNTATRNM